MTRSPFLESIRQVMRTKHYSIQTEDVWFCSKTRHSYEDYGAVLNLYFSLKASFYVPYNLWFSKNDVFELNLNFEAAFYRNSGNWNGIDGVHVIPCPDSYSL